MEQVLKILRIIGLLLMLVAFALSHHFMFAVSQANSSFLLRILFTGWVSLPFVMLVLLDMRAKPWAPPARILLYATMESVAILSVLIYSGMVSFPNVRPAFPFLVVPTFSLLFIAVIYLVIQKLNRKSS